jgi:hypothetical protein
MQYSTDNYIEKTFNLDKDIDTMLPDNSVPTYNKIFTPKPKKTIEYNKISEGNGKFYIVYQDELTPLQERTLNYEHMQMIIQIFIELRNALGYSSIKPHKFDMINLVNGINTFQIEYSRKYGILFSYGFKIIRADPLFIHKNKRTLNELITERRDEFVECKLPKIPTNEDVIENKEKIQQYKNDPLHKRRFGISTNKQPPRLHFTQMSYNPLPQRVKRRIPSEDINNFCYTTKPKIYGNKQVKRKGTSRKNVVIHDPSF